MCVSGEHETNQYGQWLIMLFRPPDTCAAFVRCIDHSRLPFRLRFCRVRQAVDGGETEHNAVQRDEKPVRENFAPVTGDPKRATLSQL